MKYIFISGGVISGIGKGIASATISLLLKTAGLKVAPIKFDPYLNVDAGTMNPIAHGEVFVLNDGAETDQDLGHYERFLNQSLTNHSIATQGSIYLSVIQRERRMEYGGECVDLVNGVTGEIMKRIADVGKAYDADVTVIEIGGTAGEYQNMLFLEANRLLKLRHPGDVIHVHITYLPIPPSVGEMKSKPAQMSVRDLHACGIQPDIILARAERPIDASRRKKLSEATGVEAEDVISAPDVKNVYEIPMNFDEGGLTKQILHKLGFNGSRHANLDEWKEFVYKQSTAKDIVKIAMVGKYFATGDYVLTDSYVSVIESLKHAGAYNDVKPEIAWIDAGKVIENPSLLDGYQGIIVPGGFGARDIEGKIKAIEYARTHQIPYFGLCYGMQLAVVERARNIAGLAGANSTEIDEATPYPVIHIMPDQAKKMLDRDYGGTMRLGAWDCVLKEGSVVARAYMQSQNADRRMQNENGRQMVSERHRHRFEVNNEYRDQIEQAGLKIVGTSPDGQLVEIMEDPMLPFFVGTQFHPELTSRPLDPHPLFMEFVRAAKEVTVN